MERGRVLRVLPDRERVEEELVRLLEGDGIALGADLLTLHELIELLSPDRPDGRTLIDGLTARAVLGECAAEVDLGPFSRVADRPGFLRAAQESISSLKSGRCGAIEFTQLLGRFPAVRAIRLGGLARLYARYEKTLARRGLCDAADLLEHAIGSLRRADRPLPPVLQGASEVRFEDVYEWFPLRMELVLALAERFEADRSDRRVRILLPHDPERPELMSYVDPVFEQFYRRAQESRALEVEVKEYGTAESRPARLARSVFRTPAPGWEGAPAGTIVSAANPDEEAREIARRVRALLEGGASPETIAISMRRLDEFSETLAAALERYGVPVRVRRGTPLERCPVTPVALALARSRSDGFSREVLEAIVAGGYPRHLARSSGRILRVLRETGGRGDRDSAGSGAWLRALEALRQRRERQRGDTESVELAREAVTAIFRAAEGLPEGEARAAVHAKKLIAGLRALGALGRGDPGEAAAAMRGPVASLRAFARDQAASGALEDTIEQLARAQELAGRGEQLLDGAGFSELLADAVAEVSLPARGLRGGTVVLLEVRELVGRRFDHVFLSSVIDGRFPAGPQNHPLLSEDDRARLNQLAGRQVFRGPSAVDGPLPDRLSEEPLLFYLALCAAEQHVTVSWSRADEGGKENLASRFVEELVRVRGAVQEESRPLSILPRAADAASRTELTARTSLEAWSDRALRATAPDPSADAPQLWWTLAHRAPERLRSIEARIRAERERFLFFARPDSAPGPHSGLLSEQVAARVAEAFRFDAAKPASPKVISDLGNCRFKGFAGQVLRIRGEEEADSSADAATRGDLYHRAMQQLMLDRQKAGRLPLRGDDDDLQALVRALEAAASGIASERHLGHPALWELTVEEARLLLTRLVREEGRSPVFEGLVPSRFEAVLGEGEFPLLLIEGPQGEPAIAVGGRIDRVDASGTHVAVVDYKTSRMSSLQKRFKENFLESEFQLPLYAAAVGAARRLPYDAAFVSIKDAKVLRISDAIASLGLDPKEALSVDPEVRRRSREEAPERPNLGDAVWEVVGDARAGRFPVRALDCGFCDYAAICRVGGRVQMEDGE